MKSILRYIVSFGMIALILSQVDFERLLSQTAHSNPLLLVLATVLVLAQISFLNLRWHTILNAGRRTIPFHISAMINLAGYFANTLFITSIGGIVARSGLAMRQGLSLVQAIFATFIDRFMTLVALVFFTAAGLPLLSGVLDVQIERMLSATVIALIMGIALFIGVLRSGVLKEFILSSRSRSRFVSILRIIMEDPVLMARLTMQSLIAQACFILGVYTLSLGMDYSGNPLEFLALLPVLALISSLPISLGGWGVREGAFIYGLGLIGFPMESAFLLSVQVGLVTLVAPFIAALPYIMSEEKNFFAFLKKAKAS